MKYIFIILLSIQVYSQSQVYYILSTAAFGITTGLSEGYRLREQYDNLPQTERQRLNVIWHNYKFASHVSGIALGITIHDYSDLEIIKLIKSLVLSGVIFFIAHDISYNISRGLPVFRVSKTTGAFTEKLAHPLVKGMLLIGAISINIALD